MKFWLPPRNYKTQGLTLVELLVVIIIAGALATVALPSFLAMTAKGRGAEARAGLGNLIRSQTSFRLEHGTFAGDLSLLDVSMPGKLFLFHRATVTTIPLTTGVLMEARPLKEDLRGYNSILLSTDGKFESTICESATVIPASTNIPNLTALDSCQPQYKQVQ